MMAYNGQTQTTLGQLCSALWDSQLWSDKIQPGFEPGTVVTSLTLRCSAFMHPGPASRAKIHPHSQQVQFLSYQSTFFLFESLLDANLPHNTASLYAQLLSIFLAVHSTSPHSFQSFICCSRKRLKWSCILNLPPCHFTQKTLPGAITPHGPNLLHFSTSKESASQPSGWI
jgi:hypothetical protein